MICLLAMRTQLATFAAVTMYFTCTCRGQVSRDRAEPAGAKPPSIDELLLFFPSKYPAGDWAPKDLRFDDISFSAEDKTRLHGWYCPCDRPRAIVLIAHGNAGNVASRASWLKYLQTEARVATFMFDYRGYGRSEGVPTVEGALLDAKAARAKLRELARVKDSEMLLMGESLGGAIVVQLAADSAPRGLVLQSTFSSLKDVADVHYPKLSWLIPSNKLDSVTEIARYHGPLLQSHGTADGTIPVASGEKLFRSANEPKTFVRIPGAGHNNWLTKQYLTRLDEFIGRLGLPGRSEEGKGEKSPRQVENSIGIKFVLVPPGKFTMGSPRDETRRNKDEEQHEVKIRKPFYLGVYEITQEQFEKVMGFNPSYFSVRATGRQGTSYEDWSKPGGGKDKVENLASTADFPVENVSWDEAVEFCRKLSALPVEQKAGRAYRLPSEAEWEYACRGGASSYQVFHFGNSISSEQANFRGTEPYGRAATGAWLERTCKVGSYKPNAFGLYDMHGNVWEWCSDPYEYEGDRGFRVRRGGSWGEGGEQCRSAIRLRRAPEDHRWNLGFRVVLVAPEVEQQ